jgi:hypothetical protein
MPGRLFGVCGVGFLLAGCGDPTLPGHTAPQPLPIEPVDASADASEDADASVMAPPVPVLCTDAGSSAAPGACQPKFASGVNVAWVRFGGDIPNPALPAFDTVFNNTYQAGGRVIRWWLHADGHVTPGYASGGAPEPVTCDQIADVRSILDHAAAAKVMVIISLWSFDMLNGSIDQTLLANNRRLLTDDATRQAYIDNYLAPLAAAVAGHPGLYGWEIFNEPEGMTFAHFTHRAADGGPGLTIDQSYIQKTINWFADAIHAVDPHALVTNGSWAIRQTTSSSAPQQNFYSDSALLDAGGRDAGVLDFYEAHYYIGLGQANSPLVHPASSFGFDKPMVIGEFYALPQDGVAAADTYTTMHSNGYAGAWAWQYLNSDGKNGNNTGPDGGVLPTAWPVMQAPIQNVYAVAPADINCP